MTSIALQGVWADVVGQERVVAALQAAAAAPAGMTHAWLFTGPPGSGRSVAARAFAAALQCAGRRLRPLPRVPYGAGRHPRRRHRHRDRAALDQDRPGPRAGPAGGTPADPGPVAGDHHRGRRPAHRDRGRRAAQGDRGAAAPHGVDALRAQPRGRHRHDPQPLPAPRAAHAACRGRRRPAGPPRRRSTRRWRRTPPARRRATSAWPAGWPATRAPGSGGATS